MKKLFKKLFIISILTLVSASAYSQDDRATIAVPEFKVSQAKHQRYILPITQKVTEMLKASNRFIVVSRDTADVIKERNFQKSEEFLDRELNAESKEELKDIASQDSEIKRLIQTKDSNGNAIFLGANYILSGEIRKCDIAKVVNADGSVRGYKALIGIQLSVLSTELNTVSEAKGFNSLPLKLPMFSAERAVDDAIKTLEAELKSYFEETFPLKCSVARLVDKGVIISAGSNQGVKVGDKFTVSYVDNINGEPCEISIGSLKVKNIAGGSFAECSITSGGNEIVERFNAARKMSCTLNKK